MPPTRHRLLLLTCRHELLLYGWRYLHYLVSYSAEVVDRYRCFGEEVCELVLGVYVLYVSNFALVQFSNEVVVCGNVFAAKVCYVVAFDRIDC